MTNTPTQAIAAAAHQSAHGPKFGEGECLMQVRTCFAAHAMYPDAATAWKGAKVKHRTTKPTAIPFGAPVFWTGGSHGHGHIAISTGDGWCWSTDIRRVGYFDHVPIAEIGDRWGLPLVGWTEDLNGVTVWTPPPPKPEEKPVSNWSKVRTDLLAALNSKEARAIPLTRPAIYAFLVVTRRRLAKLPKS